MPTADEGRVVQRISDNRNLSVGGPLVEAVGQETIVF
jgi:hypothetical protein